VPDPTGLVDHHDLVPVTGQLEGDRGADDPGSDHDDVDTGLGHVSHPTPTGAYPSFGACGTSSIRRRRAPAISNVTHRRYAEQIAALFPTLDVPSFDLDLLTDAELSGDVAG
jgi:hypothetical protein